MLNTIAVGSTYGLIFFCIVLVAKTPQKYYKKMTYTKKICTYDFFVVPLHANFVSFMQNIKNIYFLGIGGIGMSALARYFQTKGYAVEGYDRTPSSLTRELEAEGIRVAYKADTEHCAELVPDETLVVRTPAVPEDEPTFVWLREHGFRILKRAEVLGLVTRQERALCVAGTHGKTTTSTILAHLLQSSHIGTNAFLGGISNNYNSNLLLNPQSDFVVVEADEYDRSFHHLTPYMSVITSVDPDHLDIYGTPDAYREGFEVYAGLVQKALVLKSDAQLSLDKVKAQVYTYSGEWNGQGTEPDFHAANIRVADGTITFDLAGKIPVSGCRLGVPVWVNIENSVAAMAVALLNGVTPDEIRAALASYSGVYRRFNIHINTPQLAFVDDYAHHPTEIEASIRSIRRLYPGRRIIAVFQPHLYTRTRDFADGFRQALGLADELVLLPIYPAREKPIPGITSEILGGKVVQKEELAAYVKHMLSISAAPVALISLGAGDIDRLVPVLRDNLLNLVENNN